MKTHAYRISFGLAIVLTLLTAGTGTLSLLGSRIEPVVAKKWMLYPAQLLLQDGGLDLHRLNEGLVRDGLPALNVNDSNFELAAWLASNSSARNVRRYNENAILSFAASALGFAMCVACWLGRSSGVKAGAESPRPHS